MIVVAGKNNIAVHALEVLVREFGADSVVAIPNKTDDGKDYWQRSLRKRADELGVKIFALHQAEHNPDVSHFLSLEYDNIIDPKRFPRDRVFNIHFSDLPDYKGMYTSFWPILHGDETAAVTLHKIDHGIDTGDIIGKRKFTISEDDRCIDLYEKYIRNSISLFDEFIANLISGNFSASRQDAKRSRYFPKNSVNFSSIKINRKVTAWQLKRQIYAYSFRPYQLPLMEGRSVVEIDITSKKSSLRPGHIVDEGKDWIRMSSIDYDVVIYFDMLKSFLSEIKDIKLEVFKNKLKNICGVNDKNANGWSPIIVAAYYGRVDLVSELLSRGANVNDQNINGTSVLMYAKDFCIRHQDRSLFDYLLNAGADINLLDYRGKNLADYLSSKERKFFGGTI